MLADLGALAAQHLTARVDEVDGETGVVLSDGDSELGLSEVVGRPGAAAAAYRRVAGTLLERAAMLDGDGSGRIRGGT